jgi:hypothetical protein
VVERFVAGAAEPALLDAGEEPLRLIPEQWNISEWNGRLVLQAWDGDRNLVRKIVGLVEQRRDRLALMTERFPKLPGEMQIADLAAPEGHELGRKVSRMAFRDRFRLMLAREYPEWRIEDLSSEPNLEQSLTPSYVRAFLRLGSTGMAAMAAPDTANGASADCAGMVAFSLIWFDYLRRRESALTIGRLLLYAPMHRERQVAFRAALIDAAAAQCTLHVFDERDRAGAVDFADAGNVDSTLPPCRRPLTPNAEPAAFPDLDCVDRVDRSDGSMGFQVRGLEFARWSGGKLACGIGRRKRCTIETVAAMGREIARVRCDACEDRQHPFYAQLPERWLESQVRANPQVVDASLLRAPIYGQVPIFESAEHHGVVDLLGVDHTGRLAVIELKATADLQLPFQAIDYWLRVRKHLEAGDFARLGYFPGVTVRREAPRIILVAPALEFHSTSEAILGYLSPAIEIIRVGLATDWRRELRVMFRLRGSERP